MEEYECRYVIKDALYVVVRIEYGEWRKPAEMMKTVNSEAHAAYVNYVVLPPRYVAAVTFTAAPAAETEPAR